MKKFLTSLALALLAVFSVLPCAYAEEYVPLGSYTAGENLNCYISNVDAGAQVVSLDLPTGCTLVDDFNGGTRRLLLGGAPLCRASRPARTSPVRPAAASCSPSAHGRRMAAA